MDNTYQERLQTSEYRPGALFYNFLIVATFTTLMVSLLIFQGNIISFPDEPLDWMVLATAMFTWMALVPFFQYLLISRREGVRPKIMAFVLRRKMTAFFFLKTESRLTKSTFSCALAIPVVAAWIVIPLLAVLTPSSSHTIVFAAAAGMTIGFSTKDLWYLILVLGKPKGTLIQELEPTGLRFHELPSD